SSGGEGVNVFIYGRRTPLGKTSRGDFIIPIAERIPPAQGLVAFTLPWIDSDKFFIKIKEYDGSGILIAAAEKEYRFRPAVLENRLKDGIYLDLHQRVNQRLYVQKDRRITHVYLCSSSENYRWLPPKSHPSVPHDHAGVFKVLDKKLDHYSKLYEVHMRWSMHYLSGHFIHATYPNLYRKLGRPASHGCNRLTRSDAEELYKATPTGTRVEVIGTKG
ncbi:MAG TPA: L,D-transpeptidase, partial [Armatimonadota bacterium]